MSNNIEILEDSPNGYKITVNAPQDPEKATKYYLSQLDLFEKVRHPIEYSTICYAMARILFRDKSKIHTPEERAKQVENSLYYFTQALEAFTVKSYPIMFAIINIFIAKLFRERSLLFSRRNFLSDRGSPEESLMYGLDAAMEALPLLSISKQNVIEHALCCLELGYLYVLQSEYPANADDTSIREQGITYLDRVIEISEKIPESLLFVGAKAKTSRWNPLEVETYPLHIKILLDGHNLEFLDGCAYYLMGRLEQGWGLITYGELHEESQGDHLSTNPHVGAAFEHFNRSVSKGYLSMESSLWADAHHRTALLVIKYPELVDPDFFNNRANIHLESAISHFHQGLKCPALTKTERMDMHFHLAQTYIMALQSIIDRVPPNGSVTKAVVEYDGLDIIDNIDLNLREALKRVTAANNQSVQDAYLYFYATLKLAEYRMLQAACAPPSRQIDREQNMHDALSFIIDACISRPLPDNMDLHYIATGQLAQVLLAVKRTHGASKAYTKLLLCMTILINRAFFNTNPFEGKLRDDALKHSSQAILTAIKDTKWIKLHLGPQKLHEKVAAGYAVWSFEDLPSSKKKKGRQNSDDMVVKVTQDPSPRIQEAHDPYKVVKPVPPKGVPPLRLPMITNTKKVYIGGEDMPDAAFQDEAKKKPTIEEYKPPPGPVPLSALGHSIPDDAGADDSKFDARMERRIHYSPYTHRLRSKVPPLTEAAEIDKSNRIAFSLGKGRVAYLLPKNKQLFENRDGNNQIENNKQAHDDGDDEDDDDESGSGDEDEEEGEDDDEDDADGNDQDDDVDDDGNGEGDDEREEEKADENPNDDPSTKTPAVDEKMITRPRSAKIRLDSSSADPPPTMIAQPPPGLPPRPKKRSVLGWMFSKKNQSNKNNNTNTQSSSQGTMQSQDKKSKKPKSMWQRLFGKKKRKKKNKRKKAITNLSDNVGLWSSKHAFYVFMVHSRLSRMNLITRSKRLQVLDGARTCSVFFYAKPKYLQYFYRFRTQLAYDCSKIIAPPISLKELSQLSFAELTVLFRSHAKIAARFDDLEHFLYFKMTKIDYFVPLVTIAPAFSRDIGELDESLLNADTLMANIAFEKELAMTMASDSSAGAVAAAQAGNHNVVLNVMNRILAEERKKQHLERAAKNSRRSRAKSGGNHTTIKGDRSVAGTAKSIAKTVTMNAAERLQELEEREDVLAGKMTYSLSQQLDGCGYLRFGQQGAKEMLMKHLGHDECMLLWHQPSIPSQKVTCLLVWRENSESIHEFYSSKQAFNARLDALKRGRIVVDGDEESSSDEDDDDDGFDPNDPKQRAMTGMVMEFAHCELESSHLTQHIQRYLEALHATPFAVRIAQTNDALRSLSCALSMTELLLMIPPRCRSLLICCPPLMRVIPWHALLIEVPKTTAAGTTVSMEAKNDHVSTEIDVINLLERYVVRLAPSLSIFELVSTAASMMRQSVGLHRLCAVDGDDRARALHGKHNENKANQATAGGIRGADLEVACIAHTWSADPEDYHVLANDAAAPHALETGLFSNDNLQEFKRFREEVRLNETEEERILREHREEQRAKREEHKTLHHRFKKLISGKFNAKAKKKSRDDDEEEEEEEDDDDIESDFETEDHRYDSYLLTLCRVLHIAANRSPMIDRGPGNPHDDASLILPAFDDPRHPTRAGRLTATEFVQQMYTPNCALCVLSRFGLTDDVYKTTSTVLESQIEFIEAVHLSGPTTVMYPLWDGSGGQGVASLARTLFMIRFYAILPSKSRDRVAIAETVRRTQLWLRDVSANDAIAFIAKAPLPQKARETVIAEMEAYCSSSVSESKSLTAEERERDGNRPGGSRKFFNHFLSWACFQVSGQGGNVHHPDLTQEDEDEFGGLANAGGVGAGNEDDLDIRDMEFEVGVLRMEDRIDEARELEAQIARLRQYRRKKRLDALKKAGWRAGRGMMDTVDYLDKALLDQESDEISVSSEDSDDNDAPQGNPDAVVGETGDLMRSKSGKLIDRKVQPGMAKERDVAYEKWKARVGGLSMQVKAVELKKKKPKGPSPSKKDNYEFSMMQSAKMIGSGNPDAQLAGGSSSIAGTNTLYDGEEEEEDLVDDAGETAVQARDRQRAAERKDKKGGGKGGKRDAGEDEADDEEEYEDDDKDPLSRFKKNRKKKKKTLLSEITGGVRTYGEIVQMIAEQPQRMIHENREKCQIS